MSAEPRTAVGMMLRAIARRDNDGFENWRHQMNRSDVEKRRAYPLVYEAFRLAVVRRFQGEDAIEDIREFLSRPRVLLWSDRGFSHSDAGLLMRSALGEHGLVSPGLATADIVITRVQVFAYLIEDMELSDSDLDELILESEKWVLENQAN